MLAQDLKNTIEHTWPQWKIDWYNTYMAISDQSNKLKKKEYQEES